MSLATQTWAGEGLPSGRVWRRWGVSFAAVLAVHASIFLSLHHKSPAVGLPKQAAIMMDMAPEPTAAPATPASATPPPPVSQPPLPPPPVPDNPPPLRQVAVPLPTPLPRPAHVRPVMRPHLPVSRPVVRPAPPAQAAARAAQPAPSAPVAPAPAVQSSARPAETAAAPPPGETLAEWQAQLLAHLALYKQFPPGAQERGEQGVVLMRVTLDHDGHVLSTALAGSSGYPDLDAEAAAWIKRASPLPAFPPSVTAQQVNLVIPLRFTLQ